MKFDEFNEEVFFTTETITCVGSAEIDFLKERARGNRRQRARLCAHRGADEVVHEMLIVHARDCYVRPHKHRQKSESFHVIEGELQVVIFDDAGQVVRVIRMGEFGSGGVFYYRLDEGLFHTVIPVSNWVVFHETTKGPFDRAETIFAEWAPTDEQLEEQQVFLQQLKGQLEGS